MLHDFKFGVYIANFVSCNSLMAAQVHARENKDSNDII